jgi:hypothetical protein
MSGKCNKHDDIDDIYARNYLFMEWEEINTMIYMSGMIYLWMIYMSGMTYIKPEGPYHKHSTRGPPFREFRLNQEKSHIFYIINCHAKHETEDLQMDIHRD